MNPTGYAAPQTDPFHDRERAFLRRRANRAGWVLLIFLGVQVLLAEAVFLAAYRLPDVLFFFLPSTPAADILLTMVEYLLSLGAALAVGLIFCRRVGAVTIVSRKVPAAQAVALLAAGLGTCVFANFIASYFSGWLAEFGVEQPLPPSLQDGSLPVLLLSLLSSAVLPAILEEWLFRGVILQLLRPAGDLTALILSSVLFGITHGTVTQIPFATVIGLACGYFVLKTGNIYLGMALHFLNNAAAVILEGVLLNASEREEIVWNYSLFIGFALLGLVGWLYLRHHAPDAIAPILDGRSSRLSRGERRRAAWLAPAVVIFILLMLLLTLLSTEPLLSMIEEFAAKTVGAAWDAFDRQLPSLGGLFYG